MSTEVKVSSLPDCQLCAHIAKHPAAYDASIPAVGSWAYVCEAAFVRLGCGLGTGRGQRLILQEVTDTTG